PFLANEALTPLQALKGMTIWAAYACKLEHRKGKIEKGYDADFTVLNINLLKTTEQELRLVMVVCTIRNGIVVYKLKS
ncbi:MAG: amidohydrolase family protein, partial [Bacteroidetes bacterium]|nr:amidohydrolase family protein [Bacteroidota bacterium]